MTATHKNEKMCHRLFLARCFSFILTQQQQQQHQDEKTSSVCERVHTTSPTKHRSHLRQVSHASTQRGTQTGERAQAEMETEKAQQSEEAEHPLDQSESATHTRRAAAMVWLYVRWIGLFIRSLSLFFLLVCSCQ